MAIIATHKTKGGRFAVLGATHTKWRSERPHWFFGNWESVVTEGELRLLAVCGADGVIQFAAAAEMQVLTIDGVVPRELLADQGSADGASSA